MRLAFAILVCALVGTSVEGLDLVPPEPAYPAQQDSDANRVLDGLERIIGGLTAKSAAAAPVPVVVVLEAAPGEADLAAFTSEGGHVRYVYRHALYGLAGELPADRVRPLARRLANAGRLLYISHDGQGSLSLDRATRIARARPAVWDQGFRGSSDTTIAIIDTGIDSTHVDLAGRVSPGWVDTTPEAASSPCDSTGHGTFVASVALGSGAGYGVGFTGMTITSTVQGHLPDGPPVGPFGPLAGEIVNVKATGTGALSQTLTWVDNGGTTTAVYAQDTSRALMASNLSSTSPNALSHDVSLPGFYLVGYATNEGPTGSAFAGEATYLYTPSEDGYPLFQGMAPDARVLGVKITSDCGEGFSLSGGVAGIDWIVAHRDEFNIRVANMSWNVGGPSPPIDSAVNTAVANGIVMVASAGNNYPFDPIDSPATANKVIAVGAITDQGAVTSYSSNGPNLSGKPDVVAPGGSFGSLDGGFLHAAESNDGDGCGELADQTPDNLTSGAGTSASSPVVAGLAALLIGVREGQGVPWTSTEAEALEIKGLILMTATETNKPGELAWDVGFSPPQEPSGNDPSLDRGGHDPVEGYGKINADAAVEALANTFEVSRSVRHDAFEVGSGAVDRKARAWRLQLDASVAYDLALAVPLDADLDLYLYEADPDQSGIPVMAVSSTSVGGADERIEGFVPPATGPYVAVAKLVSGEGAASFQIRGEPLPRRAGGRVRWEP